MLSIEQEQRPDILRQIAVLLDRENRHLHERIQKLTLENAQLKGADEAALQLEIEQLKELLAQREHSIFGASSERRRRGGLKDARERPPQTGHGPTSQPQLPVVEETYEQAADKRACLQCGGTLEPIGEQAEEAEEITVVQRRFVLVRQRRQTYRCRCNGTVVMAPGPAKLILGGRYTPEFAVEVATAKYLDHLPLERQSRIMAREGLTVASQTLWDQIDVFEPSYQALRTQVLQSPVVHADETRWRLTTREGTSKWWVWEVASPEAVYYRLCGTRSEKEARAILSGYEGIVLCDGYSAYRTLAARAGPGPTLAHCWAHARRKFIEAEPHYPALTERPLELIGELFAVEREVPRVAVPEPAQVLEMRQKLHAERSKPVVDKLGAWARETQGRVLPKSAIGKAINYLREYWKGLTRFLEDPRIPLDNNLAERELRGVVIGRKNHYGSRSRRGTEVAAILYSLNESAKLAGVEPRSYLIRATRAALEEPGAVTCLATSRPEPSLQNSPLPQQAAPGHMGYGEDLRSIPTRWTVRR